jgi:hypothetical protein
LTLLANYNHLSDLKEVTNSSRPEKIKERRLGELVTWPYHHHCYPNYYHQSNIYPLLYQMFYLHWFNSHNNLIRWELKQSSWVFTH